MNNATEQLREKLRQTLTAGFRDDDLKAFTKSINDVIYEVVSNFEYYVKEDLSWDLSAWVQKMADAVIEDILSGNVDQMRYHLQCQENQYTGRDQNHPVIHGRLRDYGPLELRKQIVDAHADLLKSERILDLEDQVKSLVGQVVKAESERDRMWERLRGYE